MEIKPDWKLVKISERSFWNPENKEAKEVLDKTTNIYGVWAFDQNLHVHICSLTPSYEIWWVDGVYDEIEGLSDEQREELNCRFLDCNQPDSTVDYMDVSSLDRILAAHPDRVRSVSLSEPEEAGDREVPEEIIEGWATGALMF